MSGTTSNSKAAALARVRALIAGAQQHFPSGTFTLGNAQFTTTSLVQELQSLADAMAKRDALEAGLEDARNAVADATTTVGPLLRDFRRVVLAAFANATQTLADFGLQPPTGRKPLTTEKRAVATAKLRATRKARGTTSRKQRLAIKGDVTGVTVTPITQPTSPSQPASTASGAPAAPAAAPVK
jgi:hypothetical protein